MKLLECNIIMATIEDARQAADSLRLSLPNEVKASALTLKSKTPFKALVLREALIHRVSSLTDGAISEFDATRWVSGTILIRAIAETASVLHSLEMKISEAIKIRNDNDLTEFLRRTMIASRSDKALPEAINVLNLIDKADKDFPGFRKIYDALSEYAHPNWCGVIGAFSEFNYDTYTVAFDTFKRRPTQSSISALMASLVVATHAYNSCAEKIEILNGAFNSGKINYD